MDVRPALGWQTLALEGLLRHEIIVYKVPINSYSVINDKRINTTDNI